MYSPVTDKDITIVSWLAPLIVSEHKWLKRSWTSLTIDNALDAFKKYGLRIPYELSDNISIVPLGFLYDDAAARTLGISQDLVNSIRNDLSTGVISWGDAAATIQGTVSSIIVVGPAATVPAYGGLRTVLIHELIHAGGRAGSGEGVNGDLTSFEGYKEIQAACGGKSN